MNKILKNEKLWLVIAGAAGIIIGGKILKSKKTRELAVSGIAKGMKFSNDAMAICMKSMTSLLEDKQ